MGGMGTSDDQERDRKREEETHSWTGRHIRPQPCPGSSAWRWVEITLFLLDGPSWATHSFNSYFTGHLLGSRPCARNNFASRDCPFNSAKTLVTITAGAHTSQS